jgi:SAM-dependent methyltransferase
MQDVAAERDFYETLFEQRPDNEHIADGYDDLHALAFAREPDGLVLDLGCGTGAHAVRLARRGYDVVAVDLTYRGVASARERFAREGLSGRFVVADAEALPFRDRSASVTWAALLLHHFPDPTRVCTEIARVTRDRIAAFEPNAGNVLTWLAMNVINRFWGISAMTRNQVAHRIRRLERLFIRAGLERNGLHYVHREWSDRLSLVRRAYVLITAWLPMRFRANKYLILFARAGQ